MLHSKYHLIFIQEMIYSILKPYFQIDTKCHRITDLRSEVLQTRGTHVGSWQDVSKEMSFSPVSGAWQRKQASVWNTCRMLAPKSGKKPFCSSSKGSGKKAAHCLLQDVSLENSTENAATSRKAFSFNWSIYFPPHYSSLMYVATYITEDMQYILSVMVKV